MAVFFTTVQIVQTPRTTAQNMHTEEKDEKRASKKEFYFIQAV